MQTHHRAAIQDLGGILVEGVNVYIQEVAGRLTASFYLSQHDAYRLGMDPTYGLVAGDRPSIEVSITRLKAGDNNTFFVPASVSSANLG